MAFHKRQDFRAEIFIAQPIVTMFGKELRSSHLPCLYQLDIIRGFIVNIPVESIVNHPSKEHRYVI